MREASSNIVYLKDYAAPPYLIDRVELSIRLFEEGAEVHSCLHMRRSGDHGDTSLRLDGEELELRSLKLDGQPLAADTYTQDEESLVVHAVPNAFVLESVVWIRPQDNKRLEGLYQSSSMFCTQCEAEGFRRITFYLDRPDVMAEFTTRVEAEKSKYPVLLSNGNPVDSGELDGGRHFVTWHDPFPKPCYLFALVAGDLHLQQDRFTTCSGREVDLRIYVDHKNADKCDYALDCLKRSMKWDEEVYGREYDLDIFMIVAVDDFNMGAMENKGLNIFNSSCVLAKPDAATDATYQRIEAIVAHEYFHNWSGNRVTCRDWFQLSLKEGFTVYRDSQFSADMGSAPVKRIDDVNLLRTAQFAEDAGPMAHPVRPASYMEISNFYTLTVYEKGAEVVRMLHTLLGAEKFREGSDLYFERHDGQAVTTDDFVAAMAEVSGRDLMQFKRWYTQAGTPIVEVSDEFDQERARYTLRLRQSCPATPGQAEKEPFHIPVALGLIAPDGSEVTNTLYELTETEAEVHFEGVVEKPIPSLLRGFSAPVKLRYAYSDDELLFLMQHDQDGFNRWDAGQVLAARVIAKVMEQGESAVTTAFIEAYRSILMNRQIDNAMLCKLLMLPSESYLIEQSEVADVEAIHRARETVRKYLAQALETELLNLYADNHVQTSQPDLAFDAMSQRALKNGVLALLSAYPGEQFLQIAREQFESANTMTDSFSALSALVNSGMRTEAEAALNDFYQRWRHDNQVMEQWFSVQAASPVFADLDVIKRLMAMPDFSITNPNKVRSVIGAYCNQNHLRFHDEAGTGYTFLADQVMTLDDINPQIASRLLTPLTRWKKYDASRQEKMLAQLRRIHAKEKLSKDVREVVEKSLAA
ncbi:MAG: aminopeptidase N [Oleiphilaceae bacterium]|nr:aminopeptidase N [Oleiphilaceae bacterium]